VADDELSSRHCAVMRPAIVSSLTREQPLESRLPSPEAVEHLELEEIPRFLGALAELAAYAQLRAQSLIAGEKSSDNRNEPDRLLTVPEIAARMGCSPDYVYRNRHSLPFVRRLGRSLRASERELDRWIGNGRR
jgi:excisionase family DNA binding protein